MRVTKAAADGYRRCSWCTQDPLYVAYHDTEWGVPLKDARALFELLCLEGAQAGLSWWTILKKREGYRRAFAGFDPVVIVTFGPADLERLIRDPGIVRHRQKIEATIGNARAFLDLTRGGIDFSDWIWQFAPKRRPRRTRAVTQTPESEALSRALVQAGFRFVGPTICYAYMQAAGLVDDHDAQCWLRARASSGARKRRRTPEGPASVPERQ